MTKFRNIIIILLVSIFLCSCAKSDDHQCAVISDIFTDPQGDIMKVPGTNQGITTWMVGVMKTQLDNASEAIFKAIGENAGFKKILGACMTLVIAFYGIMLIMGAADARPYTVVMMLVKLILVSSLATNWDFFSSLVVSFFDGIAFGLTELMLGVFTASGFSTTGQVFESVDKTISILMGEDYWKLMLALLFSGWSAVYMPILVAIMFMYIGHMLYGIQIFIMSMIARALFYAVAPIFLVFALFNQTKSLFDSWLEQLMSFSVQPVFVMAFIGMFQLMIFGLITSTIGQPGYQVCWGAMWDWSLVGTRYFWKIIDDVTKVQVTGYQAAIPLDIFILGIIIMLCIIMETMINWSVEIASRFTGGLVSVSSIPVQGMATALSAGKTIALTGAKGAKGAVYGSRNSKGDWVGGALSKSGVNSDKGFMRRTIGGAWTAMTDTFKTEIESTRKTAKKDWNGKE